MNISGIEAFAVREPASQRSYTLVKVTTRSGLIGWGECGNVNAAAVRRAATALTGTAATAYEVVHRALDFSPALRAAVNMALLDIVGKAAKAPVYQVLGGPTRTKARAMTYLDGATDAALAESMNQARAAGYRAFLVPLPPVKAANQGQAFVHATVRRMESLRLAGGEDVDFVLDGAAALTSGDAASISAALERFHLMWFDEPCALSSLGAVRKLAAERVTPIGFGRSIRAGAGFQDLLRDEVADVLRPALALTGLTPIRKIAALAETYYTAVAPFHDGGPVGTAAALHLAASLPNFVIQQAPFPAAEQDRRMRAELVSGWTERPRDGFFELLNGPGLGIQVNEAALKRYAASGATNQ